VGLDNIHSLFLANFLYFTYEKKPLGQGLLSCENGKLTESPNKFGNIFNTLNRQSIQMQASTLCLEYRTSRCAPMCENENPICKCQATLLNMIFPSRNPFGLFQ